MKIITRLNEVISLYEISQEFDYLLLSEEHQSNEFKFLYNLSLIYSEICIPSITLKKTTTALQKRRKLLNKELTIVPELSLITSSFSFQCP